MKRREFLKGVQAGILTATPLAAALAKALPAIQASENRKPTLEDLERALEFAQEGLELLDAASGDLKRQLEEPGIPEGSSRTRGMQRDLAYCTKIREHLVKTVENLEGQKQVLLALRLSEDRA